MSSFKNTLGKSLRVTVTHCSHVCCFTKEDHPDICVKIESSKGFISLLLFLIYSVMFSFLISSQISEFRGRYFYCGTVVVMLYVLGCSAAGRIRE